MKHVYFIMGMLCSFSLHVNNVQAQCTTCPNGFPVDSLVQEKRLTGILPFNNTVTFNQLDLSVGMITCVSTTTTVTTILNMQLVNRDSTSRIEYNMNYTRVTRLTGPGINVSATSNNSYGPYDLGQAGVDADTLVSIGPDTVFNSRELRRTTTSTSDYLGTGTVSFNYFNNGSFLMITGNDNYRLDVAAYSDVMIRVVYYICPSMLLAANIRNFEAVRNKQKVEIGWSAENEDGRSRYLIEWSRNGRTYQELAELPSLGPGTRNYKYVQETGGNLRGKAYYRLKEWSPGSTARYTNVRYVEFETTAAFKPLLYPNPASGMIHLGFNAPQSGTLVAELFNASGQVLQRRTYRGRGLNNLEFPTGNRQTGGSYWLRIVNLESGERAVERVFLAGR
jgi:hypothetical protein